MKTVIVDQRIRATGAPLSGSVSRSAELKPICLMPESRDDQGTRSGGVKTNASQTPHYAEDTYSPLSVVPLASYVALKKDSTAASNKSSIRRCVYKYTDKYSFSRILISNCLSFDSHFECGNLGEAYAVASNGSGDYDLYELYLNHDVDVFSSGASVQWFCFTVSNTQSNKKVTFQICNFSKPDSLFKKGMRPLARSNREPEKWQRCGLDVTYTRNPVSSKSKKSSAGPAESSSSASYTLSFSHIFEKGGDEVMFAYAYPYGYTSLQSSLSRITASLAARRSAAAAESVPLHLPESSFVFRRELLCRTNAGNECVVLTITAKCSSDMELVLRPVIFITARVHPGESNSSYVTAGLLEFLVSESSEAIFLRRHFVVKIIPMLNPDGVINGNNRKSLTGLDLNRVWSNPDKNLHPTVYHAKELIGRVNKVNSKV
jgi:hypothetical protein